MHITGREIIVYSVADPGFPVGGTNPTGGNADVRHGCFSAKTCAKTKELGPVGRARAGDAPCIRHWCRFIIFQITLCGDIQNMSIRQCNHRFMK